MYIKKNLSKLVLLSGFIYVCYLLTNVNEGVFFSGDAGVKYLMTKQMADGNFSSYLQPEAPTWVKELWMKDFFPIEPPFVYNISGNYYIQYPPYFPFLSAGGLYLFGYKGLYILPALGLFLIWFGYYLFCRKYKVDEISCAVSLITLMYCSPLTLYGAMFWEHTLGVALCFLGVLLLLSHKSNKMSAGIAGILIGLSVYLRPELIVLAGLLLIAVLLFGRRIDIRLQNRIYFAVGIAISLLGLLTLNYLIYGNMGGLHGVQVLEEGLPSDRTSRYTELFNDRTSRYTELFKPLIILLMQHYPLIFPAIILVIISVNRKSQSTQLVYSLLLISILFIVLVPLLIPAYGGKQWGPRFLLGALPLLTVCLGLTFREVWKHYGVVFRWIFGTIVMASFVYGFVINTVVGTGELINDYKYRIFPLYQEVINDDCPVIIISHQWIAQELTATMKIKSYLLAKNGQDLNEIGKQAIINGQKRILFIASSDVVLDGNRYIPIDNSRNAFMRFVPRGKYGTYVIHDVELGWVTQ